MPMPLSTRLWDFVFWPFVSLIPRQLWQYLSDIGVIKWMRYRAVFHPSIQIGNWCYVLEEENRLLCETEIMKEAHSYVPPEYRSQIAIVHHRPCEGMPEPGTVGWKFNPLTVADIDKIVDTLLKSSGDSK